MPRRGTYTTSGGEGEGERERARGLHMQIHKQLIKAELGSHVVPGNNLQQLQTEWEREGEGERGRASEQDRQKVKSI